MQPLQDPSYKPWLQRERLELKVLINIARGADVQDWPVKGKWLARFRMLKSDAIKYGGLRADPPLPIKESTVALVDVWAFLATQQGKAKWDWLRDFCKVWSKESGVALADPPPRPASSANAVSPPNQKEPRKVGRPSTKREIEEIYKVLRDADEVDYAAPRNALYGKIRSKVGMERQGFSDEAIRKAVKPLFERDKKRRRNQ